MRDRPPEPASHLHVFQDQDRDQCCPNLHLDRIGRGPDKGLDPQVLLQGLEKNLNLPALLVNRGDGGCAQFQVVGQEHDLLILDRVVDDHVPQEMRAGLLAENTAQADEIIHEDLPASGRLAVINDLKQGVAFDPANEIYPLLAPFAEQRVIRETPVYRQDRARGKVEAPGNPDLVGQGVRDPRKHRQIAVVIQEQVDLDCALGRHIFGPGKKAETEVNHRSVQTQQLVLEPELVTRTVELQPAQTIVEQVLKKFPTPVLVGVGQRGFARRILDSQVPKLPAGAGQPAANLAQGFGLGQVTEKHGRKLLPAAEAFAGKIDPVLLGQTLEGRSAE